MPLVRDSFELVGSEDVLRSFRILVVDDFELFRRELNVGIFSGAKDRGHQLWFSLIAMGYLFDRMARLA